MINLLFDAQFVEKSFKQCLQNVFTFAGFYAGFEWDIAFRLLIRSREFKNLYDLSWKIYMVN